MKYVWSDIILLECKKNTALKKMPNSTGRNFVTQLGSVIVSAI